MSLNLRHAIGPNEVRQLDTDELRANFLIEDLFVPGSVAMTYSGFDRMIMGGAAPTSAPLKLETHKEVGSDPFLARREMGIVNIGGSGSISVDGESFALGSADCLYVPMGATDLVFESADAASPARFYFVSAPAHHAHELKLITQDNANRLDLGSPEDANQRVLRQYIHPDVCTSCQLTLGITEIQPGSVWNTMPCHVHNRRSEAYLYFKMQPETRVFHFMGEPEATRHMVVANEQAIISPGWSVHCGAGTGSYAFIWAMAGDNQDFTDMDFIDMADLK